MRGRNNGTKRNGYSWGAALTSTVRQALLRLGIQATVRQRAAHAYALGCCADGESGRWSVRATAWQIRARDGRVVWWARCSVSALTTKAKKNPPWCMFLLDQGLLCERGAWRVSQFVCSVAARRG